MKTGCSHRRDLWWLSMATCGWSVTILQCGGTQVTMSSCQIAHSMVVRIVVMQVELQSLRSPYQRVPSGWPALLLRLHNLKVNLCFNPIYDNLRLENILIWEAFRKA